MSKTAAEMLDEAAKLNADTRRRQREIEDTPIHPGTGRAVKKGVAHVTTGRVYDDSTPFRFYKAFGHLLGHIPADQAKVELEVIQKFRKAFDRAGYSALLGATHNKIGRAHV